MTRPQPSDTRTFFSCEDRHPAIWWKGAARSVPGCPLCQARRRLTKLQAVQRHAEYLRGKLNEWERRAGKRLTSGGGPERAYFED